MIKSLFVLLLVSLFCMPHGAAAQAVPVRLAKSDSGWELMRGGEPYFIKGGGGQTQWSTLVEMGGNSVRTWDAENAQTVLDSAHKHGVTVMLGLWMQHERHGFDYSDEEAVARQLEKFTAIVKKYKDHPALLMWAVGNEVDLFYSNLRVWDAVQDVAAMIQKTDPHHPTTTITAGLDPREVTLIKEKAPAIDIYGINTYGAIDRVASELESYGWERPYIIAEWGPNGHWEVDTTTWGAPLEQSSTSKAKSYARAYSAIAKDKQQCLGSYVFLWGQKQEVTSTWYGLFTEWGARTEPLDQIQKDWSGRWPENRAPTIAKPLQLNGRTTGADIRLTQGEKYRASISFRDAENDSLQIFWRVYPESEAESEGGDYQPPIPEVKGVVEKQSEKSCVLHAAMKPGAYRLFAYATDPSGKTAYANIPFFVYQPENQ